MKDLNKELLKEKMRHLPNKAAILFLQRVLDGHAVTKNEFIDTEMGIDPKSYFEIVPSNIKSNCEFLLTYAGGLFVQVLDNDEYLYEVFDNEEADEMHTRIKSSNLKDVLSSMWRLEANKLFNKIK